MTLAEFKISLSQPQPPAESNRYLQALWQAAKGDWDTAHRIVQAMNDNTAAWIHAYLHRQEGDLGNAAYWYSHAGKPRSTKPLQEEWEEITRVWLE